MHIESKVKDKLTAFASAPWLKFLNCAAKWGKLHCNEGKIALQTMMIESTSGFDKLLAMYCTAHHHRTVVEISTGCRSAKSNSGMLSGRRKE